MCIFAPLLHSHAATVRHSLQVSPVDTDMDTAYQCVDVPYACELRVRFCASVHGTAHICAGTWNRFDFGTVFLC